MKPRQTGCRVESCGYSQPPVGMQHRQFESLSYSASLKVQEKIYLHCAEKIKSLYSIYYKTSFISVVMV